MIPGYAAPAGDVEEWADQDGPRGDSGDTRGDTPGWPLTWESDSGDSGDSSGCHRAVTAAPRRTAWTAAELMRAEFPPPRWAVPGLIAEGVNLLAGAPKIGKSWLSLALGVDVATGGKAFGTVDVDPGDVLYLALEDTGRRLQSRLRKVLDGAPAPERLTLATSCPPFPEGAAHITRWLDQHPHARMVVVDVLAKMRGPDDARSSAYTADYAAVTQIKRIADDYGVAVVLVHHVRKQASDDFLAEVSGTNGIAGAADAILVLKRSRGTADGALHITGRDVDEAEHALRFEPRTGRWSMLPGPAIEHLVSDTRATIYAHLREYPGHGPKQIADGTGLAHTLVKQTCTRMAEAGQIVSDGRGRYRITPGSSGDTSVTVTAVTAVTSAGQGPTGGVTAGVTALSLPTLAAETDPDAA